jgi:hypothetical protein
MTDSDREYWTTHAAALKKFAIALHRVLNALGPDSDDRRSCTTCGNGTSSRRSDSRSKRRARRPGQAPRTPLTCPHLERPQVQGQGLRQIGERCRPQGARTRSRGRPLSACKIGADDNRRIQCATLKLTSDWRARPDFRHQRASSPARSPPELVRRTRVVR